jgi:hypothetical protein
VEGVVEELQEEQHGYDHRDHSPHEQPLDDSAFATVSEEQHVDEDQCRGEEEHQPKRRRDDAAGAVDAVAARFLAR